MFCVEIKLPGGLEQMATVNVLPSFATLDAGNNRSLNPLYMSIQGRETIEGVAAAHNKQQIPALPP